MTTRVINIRNAPLDWPRRPEYQYIGRAGRGFDGYFGNPLHTLIGYDEWFVDRLKTDLAFREAVKNLAGKTLVCFCKPKPCHGDTIAIFADALAAGVL